MPLSLQAARLWIHEVERVFRDRMVSDTDMAKFDEFKTGITKKYFGDLGMTALQEAPLLFTSFMQVGGQNLRWCPADSAVGRQRGLLLFLPRTLTPTAAIPL